MRGLVIGLLGLTLLQAVLSSQSAPGRVGGLLSGTGALINRLADPTIPLIPPQTTAAPAASPTPAAGAIFAANQAGGPPTTAVA